MKRVSAIVALAGNVRYGAQCIARALFCLPKNTEIIAVGAGEAIAHLKKNTTFGVKFIPCESTCTAARYRAGAEAAAGESIFFIQEDVVLTKNAYTKMKDVLRPHTAVTAVTNRSFYAKQTVMAEDYQDFDGMEAFARKVEGGLSAEERVLLDPFCLLMERELYQAVLPFDVDLQSEDVFALAASMKLHGAGAELFCAPAYVHREGVASEPIVGEQKLFQEIFGLDLSLPRYFWEEPLKRLTQAEWKEGEGAIQRCVAEVYTELPLVSVMIPTYNRPRYFEETLKSVLVQDYPNMEIIICDNSTNEDTAQLMQSYTQDPRVHYYRNAEAKSKEENFMPFEHLAKGEYFQWLMDDDLLAPQKLSKMMGCFLTHPEVALVSSRRGVIDGEGNFLGQWFGDKLPIEDVYGIFSGEDVGRELVQRANNFIGEPSAVLFRRKDLKHHYFHADCRGYLVLSDVVMWLEILEHGDCAIFRDALSYFRNHTNQEGQTPDVILLGAVEWLKLQAECEAHGVFRKRKDYLLAVKNVVDHYRRYCARLSAGYAMQKRYDEAMEQAEEMLRKEGVRECEK